jgi:hypothetical protein
MQDKHTPDKILDHLKSTLEKFDDISNFSTKPGIYAIGFDGQEFLLVSARDYIKLNDIIYIGKAENSQKARDMQDSTAWIRNIRKTHWSDTDKQVRKYSQIF